MQTVSLETHQFPVQPGSPPAGGDQPNHQPAQQHGDASSLQPLGQQVISTRGTSSILKTIDTSSVIFVAAIDEWTSNL